MALTYNIDTAPEVQKSAERVTEARAALQDAAQELAEKKKSASAIRQRAIEAAALAQLGEGTQKDVDAADKRRRKAEADVDVAQDARDKAQAVVEVLIQREAQAREDVRKQYVGDIQKRHRTLAPDMLDTLERALTLNVELHHLERAAVRMRAPLRCQTALTLPLDPRAIQYERKRVLQHLNGT